MSRWRAAGPRRNVLLMNVKLVVLYTQPDDPDVFERHYAETHMPMVYRIPGLDARGDGPLHR